MGNSLDPQEFIIITLFLTVILIILSIIIFFIYGFLYDCVCKTTCTDYIMNECYNMENFTSNTRYLKPNDYVIINKTV